MKKTSLAPASQIPKKVGKQVGKQVVKQEKKLNQIVEKIQIKPKIEKTHTPEIKQEEEKVQQISLPLKEFNLTSILNEIDNNFLENKSSFIVDTTQQLSVFLKYKGEIIDFPLFQLEEKMKRTTKEDFIENIRKSFVRSLRCGSTLGMLVGYSQIDFLTFFKDVEFFEMDKIFTPSEIKKEEFYKKKILKPEEDVDGFGNKGHFWMKQFSICIIIHDPNLEQMKSTLNLPYHLFNFCKIVQ